MTFEVSIITPLHEPGNAYIRDTYESLLAQTNQSWEWLIIENHGGKVPLDIISDGRVKVWKQELEGVGLLKKTLSLLASAPVIVELDADDLLTPNALASVLKAFEDGADFVYSDFARFTSGTWESQVWEGQGWEYYPFLYQGHVLRAMKAPPPTPQNMRMIYWAPNHVRAWAKNLYVSIGGHDEMLPIADDHDLVCRLYLSGARMVHIPECLYLYREHQKNTYSSGEAEHRSHEVYEKHFIPMIEQWCSEHGLTKLDICEQVNRKDGYYYNGMSCPIQMPDDTVGIIRAIDSIQHHHAVQFMNEAFRVLRPGGLLQILVPSTNGQGAFSHPNHKSFWNKLSFRYYTDEKAARYLPEFKGAFQLAKLAEAFPDEWCKVNNVLYAEAHLIKLGGDYKPMGQVLI